MPDPVRIIPGWHGAEYASLVEEEKSLFDKLMDCKDADEALSIMQQLVDIEEEKAGKAYTMFTVVFEDDKAVSMSLVNLFPEDGDLTFEKKVEKDDCEYRTTRATVSISRSSSRGRTGAGRDTTRRRSSRTWNMTKSRADIR